MAIFAKDLLENPNLLDELRKSDKSESYAQRLERTEDEYYTALGEEIEQHPIINVLWATTHISTVKN